MLHEKKLVTDATQDDGLAEELFEQDWPRVLNRRRLETQQSRAALRALVEKYGRDAVIAAVQNALIRAATEGERPGRIVTWEYFHVVLHSEARLVKMQQAGIRPGDMLGAWRDAPTGAVYTECPF